MYRIRLHKTYGHFCRRAYAVVIDDAATFHRIHVSTFHGDDGRKLRADALRYAKHVRERGLGSMPRCPYLPVAFPLAGKDI